MRLDNEASQRDFDTSAAKNVQGARNGQGCAQSRPRALSLLNYAHLGHARLYGFEITKSSASSELSQKSIQDVIHLS